MTPLNAAPKALAIALAIAGGAFLAGCGGTTHTVTVATSVPPPTSSTQTLSSSTTSTPSSTSSTTTQTTTTQTPTTTRTSTGPAFTSPNASAQGAGPAEAVLSARGYSAVDPGQYQSADTLRVLVGSHAGAEQAFFFVDGRYLGTDSSRTSAQVHVLAQSDTEITLGYSLYRPSDPAGAPSAGQATVHFALNNGQLMAMDPIPSASPSAPVSRR